MLRNQSLPEALASRGVSRRTFVEFCGAMVAMLALPSRYVDQVVHALQNTRKPVLVWLEFQDCAGNSEAMLRSTDPPVADIVLDLLSWEYHETIMAAAGHQAEAARDRVVREEKGRYIAVVEGSIPIADDGVYCTIGGRTALDIAREVCSNSALNIAVGACAWDGGIPYAKPNPTGARGLQDALPGVRVVNLGGCPHNPANTAAVLVHYLTFGEMPALDQYNRPLFAYGQLIHDQCERRAHFDAGRFVQAWDDEGARQGWCLYKMGCKGPEATFNCPTVRWNGGTSWPVKAGHGCIACASHHFWDAKSPFYERLPDVPTLGTDMDAGTIGLALTGGVVAALTLHGFASAARAQMRPRGEEPRGGPTEVAQPTRVVERDAPPKKS
jgi:hydrogenase small subunit